EVRIVGLVVFGREKEEILRASTRLAKRFDVGIGGRRVGRRRVRAGAGLRGRAAGLEGRLAVETRSESARENEDCGGRGESPTHGNFLTGLCAVLKPASRVLARRAKRMRGARKAERGAAR